MLLLLMMVSGISGTGSSDSSTAHGCSAPGRGVRTVRVLTRRHGRRCASSDGLVRSLVLVLFGSLVEHVSCHADGETCEDEFLVESHDLAERQVQSWCPCLIVSSEGCWYRMRVHLVFELYIYPCLASGVV